MLKPIAKSQDIEKVSPQGKALQYCKALDRYLDNQHKDSTESYKLKVCQASCDLINGPGNRNRIQIRFGKSNPQRLPETDSHNNCNLALKSHHGGPEVNGN